MKIYIGICLSKNNYKFLYKFLNSISTMYKFKNYDVKYIFILEKKNTYFKFLVTKLLNSNSYEFIKHNNTNIPESRNLFLKFLRRKKSLYSGFLDDDCNIDKKWLINMIKFIKSSKADILGGPQFHIVENIFYKKLFNFIEPDYKHGQKINWIATNNAFFKSSVINKTNLVFDNHLKKIGGSDQLFFRKMVKLNFDCKWNTLARVTENRQKNRESIKWFLSRNFRYGFSGNYIDKKVHGNIKGTIISFIKILYQTVVSIFLFTLLFKRKYVFSSVFLILRMMGRLFSILGYKFKKYI